MNVIEYIYSNITLLDGGMGTLLQEAGLPAGELPERWNVSNPEAIIKIHRDYYDAGSNIVNANTFGANVFKYKDEGELRDVIVAAFDCVKKAQESSSSDAEKFVSLDIGPLGKLLKPYGDLDFEDAVNAFKRTIEIGAEYADLIMIETMNDSYETKAALIAAKEVTDLPVFVSNAFDGSGKLMTGASPKIMIGILESLGADVIGVNCSLGPKALMGVMEEYIKYASVPVMFKPNAGLPVFQEGKNVYDVGPEEFAEDVSSLVKQGIRIAGGCCGTTPEHISALKAKVDGLEPVELSLKNDTIVSSYTVVADLNDIEIGTRLDSETSDEAREAFLEEEIDDITDLAFEEQDDEVSIIHINTDISNIDESEAMKNAIIEIQAVIDTPLMLESGDIDALECGLRIYNGRPMVNISRKTSDELSEIIPLLLSYGAAVYAEKSQVETLTVAGIPDKNIIVEG